MYLKKRKMFELSSVPGTRQLLLTIILWGIKDCHTNSFRMAACGLSEY
jgi:hypothetical protein